MDTGDPSLWGWAVFLLLVIDVLIFLCGYYLGRNRQHQEIVAVQPATGGGDEILAGAMERGLATMCDRLGAIEGRLSKVCSDSVQRPTKSVDGDRLHYAARLARRGNSVEELMAICNLGRGEAELIKLLHTTGEAELAPESNPITGVNRA